MFKPHYVMLARSAPVVANTSLSWESSIGRLPVQVRIQLYIALINPYLIHTADIVPDSINSNINLLSVVQTTFIRRLLRLRNPLLLSSTPRLAFGLFSSNAYCLSNLMMTLKDNRLNKLASLAFHIQEVFESVPLVLPSQGECIGFPT